MKAARWPARWARPSTPSQIYNGPDGVTFLHGDLPRCRVGALVPFVTYRRTLMPHYVTLMNWTEQGVKNVAQYGRSRQRGARRARSAGQSP